MPSATVPAFAQGQFVNVNVKDYNPDGVTLDVTEPITPTSLNTSVVTASIDPTNNRKVKLTGIAPGTTSVTVTAAGLPTGGALSMSVTVTAPPNLSRIEMDTVEGPFPV